MRLFLYVMAKIKKITIDDILEALADSLDSEATGRVRDAYEYTCQWHNGRRRASGELHSDHNLGVAYTMMQLDVDVNTICASLLHDVLSHQGQNQQSLERNFGAEVTGLVVSLKKLYAYTGGETYQRYQRSDDESQKIEGIRRAILSIIEGDIRIVLIRIADCLQDLRHASQLNLEQQQALSGEAMHIYAPLANRMGIWQFKWELEDLAFRYSEPARYQEIAGALAERRGERAKKIDEAAAKLRARIREMGFKGTVSGRPKHIYSIYRKMQRKSVDIEKIYDIQALRVILEPADPQSYEKKSNKEKDEEDRNLCYQVLGAVHSLWQPIPREFDDYIASPKPNGYKSLHTAVIDIKTGQSLEVQIRTQRMHEEAEKGVAAHWAYKEGGSRVSSSAQRRIQGLRDLLTALQESEETPLGDDDILGSEALAERIYTFTPQGDVVELPAGSTPIDFAYQIHTQVGHRCRGARVNGKMVSLDYKLQSGDRLEIITAKREGPSRDWMNPSLDYTGSSRTRSKVRQWFRTQEREKNVEQGREVIQRELKGLGLSETFTIADIARALKYDDIDQFLARVGFGDIQSSQISGAISLLKRDLKPDDELRPLLQIPRSKPKGLTVRGVSGLPTKMAGCCNPIPPELIIGYITRGQGVTIHRQDCKQLEAIDEQERLIEVDWGVETETYPIPIVVLAYRRPGLIDDMNSILRGQNIDVPKTKRTTDDTLMTVYLEVQVTSLDQLNWLLKKFENLPNVIEARRQRWT